MQGIPASSVKDRANTPNQVRNRDVALEKDGKFFALLMQAFMRLHEAW
jgi:hypothetical protein